MALLGAHLEPAILVSFPYDAELQELIKCELEGAWVPQATAWVIPARHEARARAAAIEMVGTDGICTEMTNLILEFPPSIVIQGGEKFFEIGPFMIFRGRGYNQKIGAYMADNAAIISGRAEFDRRHSCLVYLSPESQEGVIAIRNVATKRATSVIEKLMLGELGKYQLTDARVVDDAELERLTAQTVNRQQPGS
jgi:hypothetical protein